MAALRRKIAELTADVEALKIAHGLVVQERNDIRAASNDLCAMFLEKHAIDKRKILELKAQIADLNCEIIDLRGSK